MHLHPLQVKLPLPQPPVKLYVGQFSYDAKKDGELSFKKGDVMLVTSNDGKWCDALLVDSGQKGKIPSNHVAEHKSLDTEK